jgi:integrase
MKEQLRIKEYKGTAPYQCYIDGLKVSGKRKRIFFRSVAEAQAELKRLSRQHRREGEEGMNISPELRHLAALCARKLEPFGKSLSDATEHYIEHLQRVSGSATVAAVFADFSLAKQRAQLSKSHLDGIRQRLGRFVADFGSRPIDSISVREIEDWLHGLELGAQSTNHFRGMLNALFSYALKRQLVERNPVSSIDRVKQTDEPPAIFTVEELSKLLAAAPFELLPAIAIQAFCGVRTEEVLRLTWNNIDLRRGFVEIASKKAKTGQRRLIPIPANLAGWLAPYAASTGPIYSKSVHMYHREQRTLCAGVGIANRPSNGLRHSFASYHLAQFQDAARLALLMGHSNVREVFVYRELVRPEEAAQYWEIRPVARANVIPMVA